MSDLDWAWAAGLFEGEGSVVNKPYGVRTARALILGMTDRDVVERFARIMGCGSIRERDREKSRPMYYWQARRWELIEPILVRMVPHMGARRCLAMENLLRNPPKRPATECPNCGGPLVVAPGDTGRRCHPCRRLKINKARRIARGSEA